MKPAALTGNHLLATLSDEDGALITPHLQPQTLEFRKWLEVKGRYIDQIYFPSSGLSSVVGSGPSGTQVEVGLYGRDGMSGLPILLGADRPPQSTVMQIGGKGHRIAVADFRAIMAQSRTLHQHFLKWSHVFSVQTMETTVANTKGKIEERLARWLLMAHDRGDSDELKLTHNFLSIMLGVRRPGVSVALNELDRSGLIAQKRGLIVIADRAGIEKRAGGFYGVAEREYQRWLGAYPRHASART